MKQFKNWKDEDIEKLVSIYKNHTNKQLGEIFNKNPKNIEYVLKKLNLKKDNLKKWSEFEMNILIKMYKEGRSLDEIATKLNRSKASVACKSNELKITTNIIDVDRGNLSYFKNIDTHEKAYWLGFIYADGWVQITKRNAELGIELNEVDIEHLHNINKVFNNHFKITKYERDATETLTKLNGKIYEKKILKMCKIRVFSREIVEDLIKNGVVVNKTKSKEFPIIEDDELFLSFLKGYIDGDGSYLIYTKNNVKDKNKKYFKITIAGNNRDFFEHISKRLAKMDIRSGISKDKESWKFRIDSTYDTIKLVKLLLKNETSCLERKYLKMLEIIKLAS